MSSLSPVYLSSFINMAQRVHRKTPFFPVCFEVRRILYPLHTHYFEILSKDNSSLSFLNSSHRFIYSLKYQMVPFLVPSVQVHLKSLIFTNNICLFCSLLVESFAMLSLCILSHQSVSVSFLF